MSTVCTDAVSIGSQPEQFSLHEVELDLHMLAERDGGGVALHGTLLLSGHICSNAMRICSQTFTLCRVRAACPARACDSVPLGLCCASESRVFSLRMHWHRPV